MPVELQEIEFVNIFHVKQFLPLGKGCFWDNSVVQTGGTVGSLVLILTLKLPSS